MRAFFARFFMEELLIGIYRDIDDFCKGFEEYWRKHLITDGREMMPKCAMSLSEIMTIVVFFHLSGQRTFKGCYNALICGHLKHCFSKRLSYNRFVEVMQSATVPLIVYMMANKVGKCSGISFIDSTSIWLLFTPHPKKARFTAIKMRQKMRAFLLVKQWIVKCSSEAPPMGRISPSRPQTSFYPDWRKKR